MADRSLSIPLKLIVRYLLTIALVWALARLLPQYLVVEGSWAALPTVAALVTLLNMFARPILNLVTLPLKLFMNIVAVILANAAFLWILTKIAERFDPATAIVLVEGGVGGWLVVAVAFGIGNWIIHHII